MKKIIRAITPPFLFNFLKKNLKGKYNSLNSLDKKIEKYLDYDNGFFVELGANDGIAQSNSLYFEKYRNWKGVLVEPTPHNYIKCRSNRSKDSKVYCNACTSFTYSDKFVEIIYSNLMTTSIGLESDVQNPHEHAQSGNVFLTENEQNFVFGALAIPLNDLLIKSNAPRIIDLLSLDVEGAEIEVLKGIDHNSFRFKYLCIETRSIDLIEDYLKSNGYDLVEQLSVHDYFFKNKL